VYDPTWKKVEGPMVAQPLTRPIKSLESSFRSLAVVQLGAKFLVLERYL